MIRDPNTTQTFPDFAPDDPQQYTLDEAYEAAQQGLWSTYFGLLIAWFLFACLCMQFAFYIHRFPSDRAVIRATVWSLFVLEIGATAYLTWSDYVLFVKGWGHAPFFYPSTWGVMLFDCSVASIVHALYAWRIYKLVNRRWLARSATLLIALLSMAQFACCVAASMYQALQFHQGQGKQFLARRIFHGWLACASIADVIITMILAIKLYTVRTGIHATDRTINRILYVTIPGGAITAAVTLFILILQLAYTGSNYNQVLIGSLTKFYSNSVLFCLNLREWKASTADTRLTSSSGPAGRTTFASTGSQSHTLAGQVSVRRDVEKTTEMGNSTLFRDREKRDLSTEKIGVEDVNSGQRVAWSHSNASASSHEYPYLYSNGPILSTLESTRIVACHDQPFYSGPSCDSIKSSTHTCGVGFPSHDNSVPSEATK